MVGIGSLHTHPGRSGPPSIHPCSTGARYGPRGSEGRRRSVTTVLVLVILALIWAAVLVPPYLQNRRETRPGDSIATFRTQLLVLERTTPGGRSGSLAHLDVGRYDAPGYVPPAARRRPANPSHAAMRRADARRRRRDVFLTLLGAVGVTLVLAIGLG